MLVYQAKFSEESLEEHTQEFLDEFLKLSSNVQYNTEKSLDKSLMEFTAGVYGVTLEISDKVFWRNHWKKIWR